MAVVWTLNAPSAGARRAPSIEDKIWDGEGTSVSATVSRTVGAGRGSQQARMLALRIISKRHSLQRYLWARNTPKLFAYACKSLISQQMRPPSERTIPTLKRLNLRRFFPKLHAKLLLCSRLPFGQCSH
jgi:hypothetical protein